MSRKRETAREHRVIRHQREALGLQGDWLNADTASKILGVSRRSLNGFANQGFLTTANDRFNSKELEAFRISGNPGLSRAQRWQKKN